MSDCPKTLWLSMIKDGRDERIAELEALLAEYRDHSQPFWQARAEAAEAEVKRLREALRPFAEAAAIVNADNFPDEYPVHAARNAAGEHMYQITGRHFRAARKAYEETGNDQ